MHWSRLRNSIFGAACAAWCVALLGPGSLAFAEAIQRPPVLGFAGYDNDYRVRRTLIASFDLDSDPAGVVFLGAAGFTTVPSEVISGARSAKLSGVTAGLQIDPDALDIGAGHIYALEYDYRILNSAGAVSAMRVLARWGIQSELHADPLGLRPTIFGSAGTQRRQFLFGSGGFPTFFLSTESAATVVVDNLRVWRIDSEAARSSPPIFAMGYPRLAKYNFDSPLAGAVFNGVPIGPYEELLGRFDLVNGVQIDQTLGDTGWAERLRARNPAITLLPYRISYSAQNIDDNEPVGGTAGLQQLFNRAITPEWIMRGPDGEPLHDQIFEGNTQLDPTWYCPRIDGLTFTEFMGEFLGNTVLPSGLWDGIHFDQAEWFPNPLLAQTINGPLPPIDMDRDGVADAKPLLFGTMRSAFESYFGLMRWRFGATRILFGNAGRIPLDSGVLTTLSGWQQEIYSPYKILENGDWDTTRSAPWHEFLRNYLSANQWTRMPQALSVQLTGLGLGTPTGTLTGHGYPNRLAILEQRDYQRMRLGLTTTLLGNGFFGYDLVDNTTPPVWFDEYALDAQGHPTSQLSGKGYLGQPLGPPAEITRAAPVLLETGFEQGVPAALWLGNGASWTSDPGKVISGGTSLEVISASSNDFMVFETNPLVLPLEAGKTYDLTATFRVLDYAPQTYAGLVTLGIAVDPTEIDFHGRTFLYHQDIEGPGQTITMRTQVKAWGPWLKAYAHFADRGAVSVDSIRLSEVGGGAYRRDFENGIVLVNPTPVPVTLTQAEVAGPLTRAGIRRIAGVQDPSVNTGLPVTAGLTIPPADGIILLANRVGAPAPVKPSLIQATALGPDSIELIWSAPVSGSRAGYLIEHRIAGETTWDRFDLAGPTTGHRLEGLQGGTTYDIRISTFDFAGRASTPLGPVQATTTGAPPVRGRITSIDPMVRGAFVLLHGTTLAGVTQNLEGLYPYQFQGTHITVNGVPARMAFVSPATVSFCVPETAPIGPAIVRIFRAGTPSGGFAAPVLDPDPPACAGDLNGDGRTDAFDFMILAVNFSDAVSPGTSGDLTFDGVVNLADFIVFAGDFGCGT